MTDIKAIDTGFDYDSPISRAARSGRLIAEHSTEAAPLIGHLTIGIYGDGTYSCGFVMPEDHIMVKLDFSNAFNCLHRYDMLLSVQRNLPDIYAYCYTAYMLTPHSFFTVSI